jgi:hypothetical protein
VPADRDSAHREVLDGPQGVDAVVGVSRDLPYPEGVGFDNTSGCFRLTNTDIVDLFQRVPVGARVVVR